MFEDLIAANARYQAEFHDPGLAGTAARGLAILTCIDSRIAPLAMLGLAPGDAKVIRNAGARATTDALRSLVLAVNLLGVDRICVVQHTDCAVAGTTDAELRDRIARASGGDAGEWEFLATTDQMATLRHDIAAIEGCPLIPGRVVVGGFVFDVHRGSLIPVTPA
jgi:carbonic anhydrase